MIHVLRYMKYTYFHICVHVILKNMDSKARNLICCMYQHNFWCCHFFMSVYDEILTNTPLILCTLSTPILCCQRLDGIVNSILDPSNLLKKEIFFKWKTSWNIRYFLILIIGHGWKKNIMFGGFWLIIWRPPSLYEISVYWLLFYSFWQGAWYMLTRTCCFISASFLDAQ